MRKVNISRSLLAKARAPWGVGRDCLAQMLITHSVAGSVAKPADVLPLDKCFHVSMPIDGDEQACQTRKIVELKANQNGSSGQVS